MGFIANIPPYHWDWHSVFNDAVAHLALTGLKYSLLVCGLSFLFGSTLGLLVAGLRLSHKFPFSQIAYVYTDFFRTTPALVQLIWVFYVLPILTGISLSPVTSGVVALSLNAGAFFAEVFRAGSNRSRKVNGTPPASSATASTRRFCGSFCRRVYDGPFRRRQTSSSVS